VIHIVDTASTENMNIFGDEKLLKCKNALLVYSFEQLSSTNSVHLSYLKLLMTPRAITLPVIVNSLLFPAVR
jgi:hypothetical protein